MKLRLRNNKGQVIEAISSFILLAVALVVGLLVVGTLEESTIGDCTLGYITFENTTAPGNATEQWHSVTLANLITGSDKKAANLSVTYDIGDLNCEIWISSTWIGNFSGTSPDDDYNITSSLVNSPLNLNYTNCGTTNVTNSSVRYYALSSCDYTQDAHAAMDTTYDLNFTAMGLLPVIILLMAAIAVISAVLVLRRT